MLQQRQVYTYTDADGTPVYEVLRFEPKTFRQRRVDCHGGHKWSLDGTTRLPYRLPEVRVGIEAKRTIVVVEGEKDADALRAANVIATTSAGGAMWPWTPSFAEYFRGATRVVVLADCDEPGRKAAAERAAILKTVVDDVRIIDLAPERADGYDVSDWLKDGHTATEMKSIIDAAPRYVAVPRAIADSTKSKSIVQVVVRRLADIEAQPVRALWANRVFYGEPFILAGPPGVGKSFISGALAAAVTRGKPPPGGGDVSEPGDVIVLALEDDAGRVLRPRYEAMGADLRRVHIIEGVQAGEGSRIAPFSLAHIEALERCLDRFPNVKYLTIDPVASMLSGVDAFRSNEVRQRLDPFLDATAARGIAVGLVMHTNKSTTQAGAGRVEGSLGGFVGRARSVLAVGLNADTGRHGVGLLKSNLGRIDVPVIAYEIDEYGNFHWLGEDANTTASELFEAPSLEHDVSIGDEVRDAILELLFSGEKSASDMSKALRAQGYSDRTVQRQRARLRKLDQIERCGGGVAGEVRWRIVAASTDRQESHSSPYIFNGDECDSLAKSVASDVDEAVFE